MVMFKGNKIPTCYASCSIGHKSEHNLAAKLKAISDAGFDAIELSMPDILSYAQEQTGKEPDPKDFSTLCKVGEKIKQLCQEHSLKILILQPFANFEGWPKGSKEREDAWERAKGWMRIMEAVGTDMLQVGSTDAEGINTDLDYVVADLIELADMLAEKSFRIAYENWCWSTHAPSWNDVWQIVQKVDRSNFGLCLDTFQSGGGEWGSPMTKSGLVEDSDKAAIEGRWHKSLEELAATVPPEKIFFLQISDAYKMDPPLEDKKDDSGLRPRGQWSHDYRPLPYDGGYLPVEDFTEAVFAAGFRSWISIEVFDGKGPEKYPDDMGPYAKKAYDSLETLLGAASRKSVP